MKILILANNDIGLYKFRKELIEELLNQGHEVIISLPNGDLVQPLVELGCSFIDTAIDRRGINPKTDFKLFQNYRKMIKKVNPDLVVTYTIKPNIYGGIVSRIMKKPYVVNITGLGTAFEKTGLVRTVVIKLYKIALRRVKVVFVENNEISNVIKHFHFCASQKIFVLNGAGVNTESFSYLEYPQNERNHFLFIGRIMKEKGIDELLAAMKKLNTDGYQCVLDIVGPLEEDYKTILESCEKEGWLKYYGYQEDVRPFINMCDCFVLPSYHEGMANTNLECASSGRPVITSNIPGCREAVIESRTGFLCEPRNSDSLYNAMKKILETDIEERKKMGVNGRKHMQDTFEKKRVIERTLKAMFANMEVK